MYLVRKKLFPSKLLSTNFNGTVEFKFFSLKKKLVHCINKLKFSYATLVLVSLQLMRMQEVPSFKFKDKIMIYMTYKQSQKERSLVHTL